MNSRSTADPKNTIHNAEIIFFFERKNRVLTNSGLKSLGYTDGSLLILVTTPKNHFLFFSFFERKN